MITHACPCAADLDTIQGCSGDQRAVIGGIVGVLAGAAATAVYASSKGRAVVVPAEAWSGGLASAILIGAVAAGC